MPVYKFCRWIFYEQTSDWFGCAQKQPNLSACRKGREGQCFYQINTYQLEHTRQHKSAMLSETRNCVKTSKHWTYKIEALDTKFLNMQINTFESRLTIQYALMSSSSTKSDLRLQLYTAREHIQILKNSSHDAQKQFSDTQANREMKSKTTTT